MYIALVALVAFTGAAVATYLLRPFCLKFGLVDYPDTVRKHHAAPTPLGGGLGVLAGLLVASLIAPELHDTSFTPFLAAMVPLLVVGLWDDYAGASTDAKLMAQLLAAFAAIWLGNVVIQDLGALLDPGHRVALNRWAIPFTAFCIIGVINAINMIDGTDGLAGGVVLVALVWLSVVAAVQGAIFETMLAFVFMGAIGGFLVFNLRNSFRERASVFLGDTGSMLLGFVLVWLSVKLTQGPERTFPPMMAVWIIGLPLLDTLSLVLRRVARGHSPLSPDREHLHHILLRAGFSERQTLAILLLVAWIFGAIGVGAWQLGVPEPILFYGAFAVFFLYLIAVTRTRKRNGAE